MGLSEEWLAGKPDRTPLEERVLRRMIDERTPKAVTPPVSILLFLLLLLLLMSEFFLVL